MKIDPATCLPHNPGRLAVLLDALDGVEITDSERRTLVWLSGWEAHTIENIAAVFSRALLAGPPRRGAAYSSTRALAAAWQREADRIDGHWTPEGD